MREEIESEKEIFFFFFFFFFSNKMNIPLAEKNIQLVSIHELTY